MNSINWLIHRDVQSKPCAEGQHGLNAQVWHPFYRTVTNLAKRHISMDSGLGGGGDEERGQDAHAVQSFHSPDEYLVDSVRTGQKEAYKHWLKITVAKTKECGKFNNTHTKGTGVGSRGTGRAGRFSTRFKKNQNRKVRSDPPAVGGASSLLRL